MFTGIIEDLGTVTAVDDVGDLPGDAVRLTVSSSVVVGGAREGDSIAVDGCCLTVAELHDDAFTADVMRETLDKTTVGTFAAGTRVNLERAVTPSTRLGGHIVQGHVDGTGSIASRTPSDHWEVVEITAPAELLRYVVAKGSIAVDGTSLTVVDATDSSLTISLIPETLARTTLGRKQPGDPVNLEVDVIAKYVEKLTGATR